MLQERTDARVLALLGRTLAVGRFFLVVTEEVAPVDLAVTEPIGEVQDVLQRQRQREDGLPHFQLARLDALGDDDLVLAGEQGDAAHLLEVHPDRIGRVAQERRAIFALFFLLRYFRNPLFVFLFFGLGEGAVFGSLDGDLAVTVAVTEHRDDAVDLFGGRRIAAELLAIAGGNVLALATDLDHSIELRGRGLARGLVLLGSGYALHRRGRSPLTLSMRRRASYAHLSWVGTVQPELRLAGAKDTVRGSSLKVASGEVNTNF